MPTHARWSLLPTRAASLPPATGAANRASPWEPARVQQRRASAAATISSTDGTSSSATTSWIFGPALAASSCTRRRSATRASRAWAASVRPSGAPWRRARSSAAHSACTSGWGRRSSHRLQARRRAARPAPPRGRRRATRPPAGPIARAPTSASAAGSDAPASTVTRSRSSIAGSSRRTARARSAARRASHRSGREETARGSGHRDQQAEPPGRERAPGPGRRTARTAPASFAAISSRGPSPPGRPAAAIRAPGRAAARRAARASGQRPQQPRPGRGAAARAGPAAPARARQGGRGEGQRRSGHHRTRPSRRIATAATTWSTSAMPTSHAVRNEPPQPGDEARAGQLGQQRAAHGQQDHHDPREAGLGGGAAHLVLQARLVAEGLRALAQQRATGRRPRGAAPGRPPPPCRAAAERTRSAHRLQRVLGPRARRQLGGHPPQLVPRRARQSLGRLRQRRRAASGPRPARRPAPARAPRPPAPPRGGSAPARAQQPSTPATAPRRRAPRRRAGPPARSPPAPQAPRPPAAAAAAPPRRDRGPPGPRAPPRRPAAPTAQRRARRAHPRAGTCRGEATARASSRDTAPERRTPAPSALSATRPPCNSSRVPAPPATRTTSATEVTAREPSRRRAWCTTRSTALATCSRTAACGSATSAISASVSSRRSASSGEFACTVRSEPS